MKPNSVVRRTRKRADGAALSRQSILSLLAAHPIESTVAVTVRVADGAVMGVAIGIERAGVQVLDPWSGRPVSWIDIDGVPHWGRGGLASTGSYESRVCSRDELISILG